MAPPIDIRPDKSVAAPTCVKDWPKRCFFNLTCERETWTLHWARFQRKETIVNCCMKMAVERVCVLSACADWPTVVHHLNLGDTFIETSRDVSLAPRHSPHVRGTDYLKWIPLASLSFGLVSGWILTCLMRKLRYVPNTYLATQINEWINK